MEMRHNLGLKTVVGILYGGKSAEHEVSLQSAKNVLHALDLSRFTPVLISIDKSGAWHIASDLNDEAQVSSGVDVSTYDSGVLLALDGGDHQFSIRSGRVLDPIDVIFPVLHGPMGEDGSMQGLLELVGLPYVGSGVLGSAVGMDKDVMKRLLRDAGIRVADFVTVTSADVDGDDIVNSLGLPLFVKPANMGSSVGVSRVGEVLSLKEAIRMALKYDTKVLIEEAIVGHEVECAVLGATTPSASIVGRVVPGGDGFYSYEAKYIDENGATLEIPAAISPEIAEEARRTALEAFRVLGCEGMARVDMFATNDGIVVNEVNTIPGFTKISMYPKLWEASGLSYTDLITRLIEIAIERRDRRKSLQVNYDGHV